MDVEPADEVAELIALTEAQLGRLRQSDAMRSDAYRTSLGVLASVTKLQAAVAKRMQPHGLTPAEREAFKVELIRAAGRDGRLLGQQLQRRNIVWMSCAIGGAFVLGSVGTLGVSYANAPTYERVSLAGDALLCRASGARVDPAGVRYYPELPVQPAPVARR